MPKPIILQQPLPSQPTHLDISYHQHNNSISQQQNKLNVEILRVHTTEKLRLVQSVFDMPQNTLCQFFSSYDFFPYHDSKININELLQSRNLKLIKTQDKIYFGQVQKKKRNGYGVNVHKDSRIYQGYFINNQKSGHGAQIYPNGNLYLGEFMNGKKHGKGQFFWFSLSSKNPKQDQFVEYYDGQWWGGLPDGQGVHQKINGDLYTGSFKNGLKHGQGSDYFSTQQTYKGEYINGLPEGYGEYKWKDGSYYKGDFKQGLRNGYGVWGINQNSTQVYKGHFCMDKKSGYGVYQWENGWVYKGNFQNDLRDGFGQLYEGNKLVYRGFWKYGEKTEQQVGKSNLLENSVSKSFAKTSSQIYNRMVGSGKKLSKYEEYGLSFNPEEKHNSHRKNHSATKKKAEHQNQNDIWPVEQKGDYLMKKRPQSYNSSNKGSPVKRSSTTERKNQKLVEFEINNIRQNRYQNVHREGFRKIQVHGFGNTAPTIGSHIARPIMRNSNMGNLYVPMSRFEIVKKTEHKCCY